ncbi:hypothetical protein AQUCO_05300131v1 [Aquilegia coerulea]|uniref:Uncharacterized protein n=1 Tax=Aquilegia coerulea TaxID=218851 RepID=A0A2G5CIG5_AQUCA|nr:hypothetical protein AQUCO_05300131v1 [Aquilegia coerulea]
MGLPLCCCVNVSTILKLVLLLFHQLVIANSLYPLQHHLQPSCNDEDISALLQFKQSFAIDASASVNEGKSPKLLSWKLRAEGENNNTCCSWDGVECHETSGHVIGLDLSSSQLYGSINSSSSLFRLVHLQSLNLADNNFNHSQIPTAISNFPRLTYLNLASSFFFGRIPSQVAHLSKLSFLDLSQNMVHKRSPSDGLLKLDASIMKSLVQNLTKLENLNLGFVDISSTVPDTMANLSLLTSLVLRNCKLFGEFPAKIFHLKNLEILSVRFNHDLTGYLPEFNQSSPLTVLKLAETSFSGHLPYSLGNLHSLKELDVGVCNFSQGPVPALLGNLRQLTYLDISRSNFHGPIPNSFANLTQLDTLRILGTGLTGPIPSWIGNLSSLVYLDLAFNILNGSIPTSVSSLKNLQILYLHSNLLSGRVNFSIFQNLQYLYDLQLNSNHLELLIETPKTTGTSNVTYIQQFESLTLNSCRLKEFPYFLRYQEHLKWLDLSFNNIHGRVPKWMWNVSTRTMVYMDFSSNFLSGFDQPPVMLPWVNLQRFKIDSNMLRGSLPIPSPSILAYEVQNNKLSGGISPNFCNSSTSLEVLDVSNNSLSGMLPQCLGNFSDNLRLLLLGSNYFNGLLPQSYTNKSHLKVIDVSQNQMQGKLPRSLENCLMLELLLLSNNKFSDVFPFWLGNLPQLKILAMRHNGFHGVIGKPEHGNHGFSDLRILDLSYNNFTGEILIDHVFSETSMIMRPNITVNESTYMTTGLLIHVVNTLWVVYNKDYSLTIANKGVERFFSRIQQAFAAIDVSSNKLEGKIDPSVGNLKGLRSFNISHNLINGSIPSSLGNLSLLESLDLSNNKLSGYIPQQLAQLTSLSQFDVSYNNITGRIPQGPQMNTFNITSFEGNPGLCGAPLPNECGNPKAPQPPTSTGEEDGDNTGLVSGLDWIFVVAGFVGGSIVGVILSDFFVTWRREWFIKIAVKMRPMKQKRATGRRRNLVR